MKKVAGKFGQQWWVGVLRGIAAVGGLVGLASAFSCAYGPAPAYGISTGCSTDKDCKDRMGVSWYCDATKNCKENRDGG